MFELVNSITKRLKLNEIVFHMFVRQFTFNLIIDWAKHCFQEPSGNSQIR